MSEALAVVDRDRSLLREEDVVITQDQVALIKQTIAAEATDAELALFFYDCRRRGVHPLDKLIHFTKRQNKYTPVTSIDFFRSRAGQTREHMGTDDACFTGEPGDPDFRATVTVYRLVHGEKCAFTATARFAEFVPPSPNDFMWVKMPYNQIAKCAEAAALRKGFPQELEGLRTVDEMEHVAVDVTPRKTTVQRASDRTPVTASAPTAGSLVTPPLKVKDVRVFGKDKNNYAVTLVGHANEYTTKDAAIALDLEKFKGTDHLLRITYVDNPYQGKVYHNLTAFEVVDGASAGVPSTGGGAVSGEAAAPPLTDQDIPFSR
jgi:phage recombination protein Bet